MLRPTTYPEDTGLAVPAPRLIAELTWDAAGAAAVFQRGIATVTPGGDGVFTVTLTDAAITDGGNKAPSLYVEASVHGSTALGISALINAPNEITVQTYTNNAGAVLAANCGFSLRVWGRTGRPAP